MPRCRVNSFAESPVSRLATVLAEPDKLARRQSLFQLGIHDEHFIDHLEKSFSSCKRAVQLYPSDQELCISFNGGKDACVVLYLWLAAVEALRETSETSPDKCRQCIIFFDSSDEFEEVRDFVKWVASSLDLDQKVLEEGQSFKGGMESLVKEKVRAVVMGQRRGDPWMKGVDCFSPSSEGWPAFMRINPIIDWSFANVWEFIRKFQLPYCSLYDDGYTSLGSVATTFRNPALRRPDGSYAAGYTLDKGELERDGRMSRQVSIAKSEVAKADASLDLPSDTRSNTSDEQSAPEEVCSSVGILVIGDEILNGKVRDCNAHYLCGMFHSRGLFVKIVEVVPDDINNIADVVQEMCMTCDFVFTCGGLGPTHDDVTMAGIAAAFRCRLIQDEKFFAMLGHGAVKDGKSRWSSQACHKMASMPQGATVEWPSDGNPWPIVSMRNVYIFAGMPSACRQMFERAASDGRFTGSRKFASVALHLDAEESDILEALQRTVDAYPGVHIGSYPTTNEPETEGSYRSEGGYRSEQEKAVTLCGTDAVPPVPDCRLTITFEAFDQGIVEEARAHLKKELPVDSIIESA